MTVDRVENDCEDQGFGLISDGCIKCQYWAGPGAQTPTRPALEKVRHNGRLHWQCPTCKGFYGEAE